MKTIVIVGAGGFAREVLWVIREINADGESDRSMEVLGFVDGDPAVHGTTVCDLPVLGGDDWLTERDGVCAVCAIGAPRSRRLVVERLSAAGIRFVSLVHPSVRMSRYVKIGTGSVVCAGSVLTTQVKVGKHVHINLNVTVGHDVVIDDWATVAPGSNISGGVSLGPGVELGSNCAVLPNISVGRGAVIGAGAVVSRNVGENVVAVGVPARPIRSADTPFE